MAATVLRHRAVVPLRRDADPHGRHRRWWLSGCSRTALTPRVRGRLVGGRGGLVGVALFAGVSLATAPLKQNEIAVALGENERFTTDLLDVDDAPAASRPRPRSSARGHGRRSGRRGRRWPGADDRDRRSALAGAWRRCPGHDDAGRPDGDRPHRHGAASRPTVPPTTAPVTTAPVTQLGVVTDMSTVTPLSIPQGLPGYPLIAIGDSVMLGAAEELGALGFIVDAQVSRQMKTYLPDMQAIKDNGLLGSRRRRAPRHERSVQ